MSEVSGVPPQNTAPVSPTVQRAERKAAKELEESRKALSDLKARERAKKTIHARMERVPDREKLQDREIKREISQMDPVVQQLAARVGGLIAKAD